MHQTNITETQTQNASRFQATECLRKETAGFWGRDLVDHMFQIKCIYRAILPWKRTGNVIVGGIQVQPAIQSPVAAAQVNVQQRRLVHDFGTAGRGGLSDHNRYREGMPGRW